MKIVFAIWLIAVILLSVALYRSTRFEYLIADGILEIRLVWAGLFSIPKRVVLSDISGVERINSFREVVPLINGTFPSLWGKFRPRRMLIISFKRSKLFPLLITPDNPEEFIGRISPLIQTP